jgi:hypothetical protein
MEKKDRKAGKSAKENIRQRSKNQRIITEQNKKVQVQCSDCFFLLSPNIKVEILNDL